MYNHSVIKLGKLLTIIIVFKHWVSSKSKLFNRTVYLDISCELNKRKTAFTRKKNFSVSYFLPQNNRSAITQSLYGLENFS